jgi:CBS domain-containing protein
MKRIVILFFVFCSMFIVSCSKEFDSVKGIKTTMFDSRPVYSCNETADSKCSLKMIKYKKNCEDSIIILHSKYNTYQYSLEKKDDYCLYDVNVIESAIPYYKKTSMNCKIPFFHLEMFSNADEIEYLSYCSGSYKDATINFISNLVNRSGKNLINRMNYCMDELISTQNSIIEEDFIDKEILNREREIVSPVKTSNEVTNINISYEKKTVGNYIDKYILKVNEFFNKIKNEIKESFLLGPSIIMLIFIITYYLTKNKIKRKIQKIKDDRGISKLKKNLDNLADKKILNIMSTKLISVKENDTISKVIDLLTTKNIGSLIVTKNNNLQGIVTMRDIIRRIDFKTANLNQIKVDFIMSTKIKNIKPDINFEKCVSFSLDNNIRKLPVYNSENKIIGVVTQTDLAKEFDRFFSKNLIEAPNMYKVRNIVQNKIVFVRKGTKLLDAMKKMIEYSADSIIVTSVKDSKSKKNILGLITEREIVNEAYINPNYITNSTVEQVMNKNIMSVADSVKVFEANKIMVKKNIRRLPVYSDDEITGIITQTDIVGSINSFFYNLHTKNKEKLKEMFNPDF